jgi:hypothetical protein
MSNSTPSESPAYIRVPLGYDTYALIDAADAAIAIQYRWTRLKQPGGNMYARANVYHGHGQSETVYLHRVLMQPPDGMDVDHINGDTLDCRRSNMRICTEQENTYNRRKRRTAKRSRYVGVFQVASAPNRWYARIMQDGRAFPLGGHGTEEEAARAYDRAAKMLRGEFAYLNFPDESEAAA